MTIDEELATLDDNVRRLKVEYDIFFGGGSKKPPTDIEWRVQNLLKKHSDGHKLNYAQRFRFNTIQQRYALFSGLWQQKLRIKEEGYRRPQDAMLGIQGMRAEQEHAAELALRHQHAPVMESTADEPFRIHCADVNAEPAKVEALYKALVETKKKAGENGAGSLDSFKKFVQQKTSQIRKEYGCEQVEYTVEMRDGQVKLKAKPKSA